MIRVQLADLRAHALTPLIMTDVLRTFSPTLVLLITMELRMYDKQDEISWVLLNNVFDSSQVFNEGRYIIKYIYQAETS